jgi:hypothetical protein
VLVISLQGRVNRHSLLLLLVLLQVRRRNEISSTSQLDIFCAESDLYVACVGGRLLVKLGPRYDVGAHNMPPGHDWEDKGQLPRA